ncbi:diphthine--ammonia ligase [Scopulibacillus cellulosilyticus]|uniref:Diphthine--ammonia ligase n=1 Tax=Scopulibacillus cellulosilyticus TaxID=2665665 RepID=A0ABW2PZW4_9BACL
MNSNKRVILSWSGGKDSCLSLHRLLENGYEVVGLVTMVSEADDRNRSHGIRLNVIKQQAKAIDLPLVMVDAQNLNYEIRLEEALSALRKKHQADAVAFGSLYIEPERKWNEQVALSSELDPLFPVWIDKRHSLDLLNEWISLGYQAVVCRASDIYFDQSFAGRSLDQTFFNDICGFSDICPMGENGEYHTFVLDGPIFKQKVDIIQSNIVLNNGLWSLDIEKTRLIDKQQQKI